MVKVTLEMTTDGARALAHELETFRTQLGERMSGARGDTTAIALAWHEVTRLRMQIRSELLKRGLS